jgi:alpha/beta superfamily hydrolase
MALRAGCTDNRVRALVLAGLPVSRHDFTRDVVPCEKPKLLVQGAKDQFGSIADLRKLFDRLSGPKTLVEIEGADHFFEGRLDEFQQAVLDFIASRR